MIDRIASRWRGLLLLSVAAGALAVLGDYALRAGGWWSGGYAGDPGKGVHAALIGLAGMARVATIGAAGLGVVDRVRRGGPTVRWGWAAMLAAVGLGVVGILGTFAGGLLAVAGSIGGDGWPGYFGEGVHARPLAPGAWLRYQAVVGAAWVALVGAGAFAALFVVWVARVGQWWWRRGGERAASRTTASSANEREDYR